MPVQLRSFAPSTSWGDGGPIIDQEKIELVHDLGRWTAKHRQRAGYSRLDVSPWVTAMRAYPMWE